MRLAGEGPLFPPSAEGGGFRSMAMYSSMSFCRSALRAASSGAPYGTAFILARRAWRLHHGESLEVSSAQYHFSIVIAA